MLGGMRLSVRFLSGRTNTSQQLSSHIQLGLWRVWNDNAADRNGPGALHLPAGTSRRSPCRPRCHPIPTRAYTCIQICSDLHAHVHTHICIHICMYMDVWREKTFIHVWFSVWLLPRQIYRFPEPPGRPPAWPLASRWLAAAGLQPPATIGHLPPAAQRFF